MTFWNFGGLNPTVKEFLEKHPEKTMLGMAWSYYWRLAVFLLVLELVVFVAIALLSGIFHLLLR